MYFIAVGFKELFGVSFLKMAR